MNSWLKRPLTAALFLIFGLAAFSFWSLNQALSEETDLPGILGGPEISHQPVIPRLALLASVPGLNGNGTPVVSGSVGMAENRNGLIVGYGQPNKKLAIKSGTTLLVLNNQSSMGSKSASRTNLINLINYFLMPTRGFNWGVLHEENAVDIANACGTPVLASAEGLVVEAAAAGWNQGYGGYILVEHPNGIKTRYAHLDRALAGIGNYVKAGQEIGVMGNTGNVHGPSGCHLHFEVLGARNPFAK